MKKIFRKASCIALTMAMTTAMCGNANAQITFEGKPRTREDCFQRAVKYFSQNINPKQAGKTLLKLIEDVEKETDPEKLKALEELKKIEMEKYIERVEKSARKFCGALPE